MKLIVEIDDSILEGVKVCEDERNTVSMIAGMVKVNIDNVFGTDTKVEDASELAIFTLKQLYHGAKVHADAEERSEQLLKRAKENGDPIEVQRMYEDTYTKQKGFKEAFFEMIAKQTGKFPTVEQLVAECGDLSGLW
jgi:hypothetical protein